MIDWNIGLTNRLIELRHDPETYSEREIASILTDEFGFVVSRDAVHNKLTRLQVTQLSDSVVPHPMPYYDKYSGIITSEGRGKPKSYSFSQDTFSIKIDKEKLKILYLGDLHIPFQVDSQIDLACQRNIAADVVVTSEVCDCYSISRFTKEINVPLHHEIDLIVRYFEFLSTTFCDKLVFVIGGNHAERVGKAFTHNVPPSLLFLTNQNLLELLAKPFENIIVVDGFYFQINDAIFAHVETFSKVDLKSAINVYTFFNSWRNTLNLNDFKLVIQGHTHMLGISYHDDNLKVIEGGCLCTIPDYAVEKFYSRPQTNGYVVVQQKDGVTDFNLTREYILDGQKYIPKFKPIKVI